MLSLSFNHTGMIIKKNPKKIKVTPTNNIEIPNHTTEASITEQLHVYYIMLCKVIYTCIMLVFMCARNAICVIANSVAQTL